MMMLRSNPLHIRSEPKNAAALVVAAVAASLLIAGGFIASQRVTERRIENVRSAVLAAGYGPAAVAPIRGDECWRGREGFTWKTAAASGSACAGPRTEVRLYPGVARPHI